MENKKIAYVITGAAGHVGRTIIKELEKEDCLIRGLVIFGEKYDDDPRVKYIIGDITNKLSLEPLFEGLEDYDLYVIHCAALISIADKKITDRLYKVNVIGTENVVSCAEEHHAIRIIHVASVDAFQAKSIKADEDSLLCDNQHYYGGYALSKALAVNYVRERVKAGTDIITVYPSGIIGPNDSGNNHLVQMLKDYTDRKIPGVIKGGYDIVDVRDVASGIVSALKHAPFGSSYILASGRQTNLKELLNNVKRITGKGKAVLVFPMFLARIGVPFVTLHCKIHHMRPLYTSFSLDVVKNANSFNNRKAMRELGFAPRPTEDTIRDTLKYLGIPTKE
jgi:dihydroflavonol-4-reductase